MASTPLDAVSKSAAEIDAVFVFILVIGVFFFLVTQGLLVYFAVKYRRKRADGGDKTPYITGNKALEAVWILIPSVTVLAIFLYGYHVFKEVRAPLEGAAEINVVGRQWLWEFTHPNGRKLLNELRVPLGEPVKLVMSSDDVIHSLFIPDFRIKEDVVPGRYTYLYFTPQRPGEYNIFCAEYCGVGHSAMNAKLFVMEKAEYDEWAAGAAEGAEPPAEKGAALFKSAGCSACHSTDGSPGVGPTLKGLFGREVHFADETELVADESYIRESILDPKAKVVKGFQPVMPPYEATLSDEDVTAIISYIKTLGGKDRERDEGRD